jgi:hypothetical protein
MQPPRILAFYSRKLTDPQTRYTVTKLELLCIVEILKEFRTILLGHRIIVYTDHKNLTFDNFTTDRVRRWRLIVEEYGPEINYIQGSKNVVVDALSHLPILERTSNEANLLECFSTEPSDDIFPVDFALIAQYQQSDARLQQLMQQHPQSYATYVLGNHSLITYDSRIVIPLPLQQVLLNWYHTFLIHPGCDRLYQTLRTHFVWRNMSSQVAALVRDCTECQEF